LKTTFEKVLPRSAIESAYLRMIETSRNIYALPGDAGAKKLRTLAVLHDIQMAKLD